MPRPFFANPGKGMGRRPAAKRSKLEQMHKSLAECSENLGNRLENPAGMW